MIRLIAFLALVLVALVEAGHFVEWAELRGESRQRAVTGGLLWAAFIVCPALTLLIGAP